FKRDDSVLLHEDYFFSDFDNEKQSLITTKKDFGVHVSTKLSWNNRIGVIISKANKMLGMIKRTCTSECDRKLS
ncbi:hypothetical protein pdam_00013229, partial [Pocillopora damicornis]